MLKITNEIPKELVDLTVLRKKPKPPSQAFSDFVIHREQGDWAECILTVGLRKAIGCKYDIVKYGKSDKIIAGQKGFKEFYEQYQDELADIGKRPDILVFKKDMCVDDISTIKMPDLNNIVKNAIFGIEIRSSSFLAKKYKKKNQEKQEKFLSFTVKLEDIHVVMRWIETYNVPHYYAQVFFDEIYIISFKKILETIRDHIKDKTIYRIERNSRNQLKTTFHINISQGMKIGIIETPPISKSERTELDSGRLLHYVSFNNGAVMIDDDSFLELITDL